MPAAALLWVVGAALNTNASHICTGPASISRKAVASDVSFAEDALTQSLYADGNIAEGTQH